jgi:6,7-dimethyl-8-ribityllumazine synthase
MSAKRADVEALPVIEGEISAQGRKVAIVAARFNDFIVSSLLKGATAAWLERGGVVARKLAASGRWDAVVALGCVIRGDTPHFDYVAGECARGLNLVSLETGVPVVFGVLTVETVDQALERAATTAGNKGGESMETALEMAGLLARL